MVLRSVSVDRSHGDDADHGDHGEEQEGAAQAPEKDRQRLVEKTG